MSLEYHRWFLWFILSIYIDGLFFPFTLRDPLSQEHWSTIIGGLLFPSTLWRPMAPRVQVPRYILSTSTSFFREEEWWNPRSPQRQFRWRPPRRSNTQLRHWWFSERNIHIINQIKYICSGQTLDNQWTSTSLMFIPIKVSTVFSINIRTFHALRAMVSPQGLPP